MTPQALRAQALAAFAVWWSSNNHGGGEWIKRAIFVAGYEAAHLTT